MKQCSKGVSLRLLLRISGQVSDIRGWARCEESGEHSEKTSCDFLGTDVIPLVA